MASVGTFLWPRWPDAPPCVALDDQLPFAWPLNGSTPQRYLVLADVPLLVEQGAKCLVGVEAWPRPPVLSSRQVVVPDDATALPLSAIDIRLADLTLRFDPRGDPLTLERGGDSLTPDDIFIDDELALDCWNAESARFDEAVGPAEPLSRKLGVTTRGSGAIDELELVLDEECTGPPGEQGGTHSYRRSARWVVERTSSGWRQVAFRVSASSGHNGDGSMSDIKHTKSVFVWHTGEVTLRGETSAWERGDDGLIGSRGDDGKTARWVLESGANELALSPAMTEPPRDADLIKRGEVGQQAEVGACRVTLGRYHVDLLCPDHVERFSSTPEPSGQLEREVLLWDFGMYFLVRVDLASEHRFTEPLDEDDPTPYERLVKEENVWTALMPKRGGAPIRLRYIRSAGSF